MAAAPKPDAAHPPVADKAAAAAAAAAPAEEKSAGKGGIMAFVPLIATVVLAPVLSFAIVQFVLLPSLKKQLAIPLDPKAGQAVAAASDDKADASADGKDAKGGKDGKGSNSDAKSYEFANVVVNLSGTMGTRYLKTTFIVTGSDKSLRGTFESNKPKLLDVTLNVLSSLSLTDLEEAGAKNLIREKLIAAYNQSLGKKTAEQVYFSDFVVQ